MSQVIKLVSRIVPLSAHGNTHIEEIATANNWVPMECLRVGHWDYAGIPGGLNVDQALLNDLKTNFDAGAKGYEVLLNCEHDDNAEAGWVKGLEIAGDGNSIFAMVEFTDDEIREKVNSEKIKFCSSELDLAWVDPEDKTEKRVFEGLALTNRPYIKRLKPIGVVLSERSANLRLEEGAEEEPAATEDEPVSGPTGKEEEPTVPEKAKEEPTGGGAVALSELEAKLKEETAARQRFEAQLAESDRKTRELSSKVRFKEAKERINKAFKRGKITPAFANNLLAMTETVITYGDTSTIKLSEKRKLKFRLDEGATDEDEEKTELEETDEIDVIDSLLDMVDTIPDGLATDPTEEKADLDDPIAVGDEEDDLDKLAKAEMKENKDMTYGKALELAERKLRDRKGGKK